MGLGAENQIVAGRRMALGFGEGAERGEGGRAHAGAQTLGWVAVAPLEELYTKDYAWRYARYMRASTKSLNR